MTTQAQWDATLEAYRLRTADVTAAEESQVDAMVDQATAALETLIKLPAPNRDALLVKLGIIETEGYHGMAVAWNAVHADVRRLAS